MGLLALGGQARFFSQAGSLIGALPGKQPIFELGLRLGFP